MFSASIVECYRTNDIIVGVTYGQWTVRWWQWALSMPANKNPLEDNTGANAFQNQPRDVCFLAGTFGKENSELEMPTRTCTIPAGRPILVPVLNCQADRIDIPHLKSHQEILDEARRQANTIVKKVCNINGEIIYPERVASDPSIYDIMIHKDYTREKIKDETSPASGDGYWVFLKGLSPGRYRIFMEGACEHGRIKSGAHYSLTVI